MKENIYSFPFYAGINSRWLGNSLKRLFDITVSLVVLTLLSPFLGFIALAIKHDSPGPVFYRGPRMGYRGKIFNIVKFRTMYETDASYAGPRVTARDDTRITPLGHWLRNTKLNEFPQFWNVLMGDMSLVGPRPEDPEIAEHWPKEVFDSVLSVRPGITSPASVQYHNEEMLLVVSNVLQKYVQELGPDKMRLDQLYVRYRSFLLDLDTLFWTFMILLPKIGMNNPPEEILFVGPFTRFIRRFLNWFVLDFLVTLTAITLAGLAWRVSGPLDVGSLRSAAMALGFALIFSLTGAALGVNRIAWSKATFADAYDLLPAWALACVIGCVSNEITHTFPTKMVLAASGLALIGYIIARYRSRLFNPFFAWMFSRWNGGLLGRDRVLIVGSGSTAQHAAWLLGHQRNTKKYRVVGIVDNDMFKQGMRVYGSQVVGMMKDLPALVEKLDVNLIVLADPRHSLAACHPVMEACRLSKAKVIVMPDIMTIFSGAANHAQAPVPMSFQAGMIPVTSSQNETPTAPQAAAGEEEDLPCLQCIARFAASHKDPAVPEAALQPKETL